MHRIPIGTAAAVILASCQAVFAADVALPVKAPPRAAVVQSGGAYFWVDGSYQSVNLPTFDMGYRNITTTFVNLGPMHSYQPRPDGAGIAAAAGYAFADGTFASAWGSRVRIELTGTYVDASSDQTSSATLAGSAFDPHARLVLLNGVVALNNAACALAPCPPQPSTLSTHYRAWQAGAKLASDFRLGAVTLTPSVTVFGGQTRNNQSLYQALQSPVAPPGDIYTLDSNLRWDDWGGKFRLDAVFEVSRAVALGLGGSVGVAARRVSLNATDFYGGGTEFAQGSSLALTANTTPLIANGEASVVYRPWASAALRAFAGVNYDSRVPGIAAPFVGNTLFPVATTPASLKFESETSWYAGGGMVVRFGP